MWLKFASFCIGIEVVAVVQMAADAVNVRDCRDMIVGGVGAVGAALWEATVIGVLRAAYPLKEGYFFIVDSADSYFNPATERRHERMSLATHTVASFEHGVIHARKQ
mmetsp:Transcript_10081/g.16066  ORF Transcript_10081/g.16066 Transcript_10081/m.16066 type:complete len:107 (+) Transcript_10081:43-363(+)